MLTLILGTVIFVGIYYFVGKEKDPMKESLKQAKNKRLEIIDDKKSEHPLSHLNPATLEIDGGWYGDCWKR